MVIAFRTAFFTTVFSILGACAAQAPAPKAVSAPAANVVCTTVVEETTGSRVTPRQVCEPVTPAMQP